MSNASSNCRDKCRTDPVLATMRFRNVSVTIILQNIAQLKALFEKQWESILGNCSNGFLTLAGGIVITFAKEILTLITG